MVDVISLVFIGAGVGLAIWWSVTNRPEKAAGFGASLIAIFAGAFLLLRDRVVELTVENVGTIKAAATQAAADASSISELRSRIEAQAATIDLVAASAEESRSLATDFSEKLDQAEARLSQMDELIQRASGSLAQLERGLTAVESRAGQLERHAAPRTLSPQQLAILTSALSEAGPREVAITAAMNDQEAVQFAEILKQAAERAGWTVNGINQALWGQPVFGLHVLAPDPPPDHATVLLQALAQGGLQPEGHWGENIGQLEIRVGSKPPL
jgi:hypothetical protein